jgi:hypothetical protein
VPNLLPSSLGWMAAMDTPATEYVSSSDANSSASTRPIPHALQRRTTPRLLDLQLLVQLKLSRTDQKW